MLPIYLVDLLRPPMSVSVGRRSQPDFRQNSSLQQQLFCNFLVVLERMTKSTTEKALFYDIPWYKHSNLPTWISGMEELVLSFDFAGVRAQRFRSWSPWQKNSAQILWAHCRHNCHGRHGLLISAHLSDIWGQKNLRIIKNILDRLDW